MQHTDQWQCDPVHWHNAIDRIFCKPEHAIWCKSSEMAIDLTRTTRGERSVLRMGSSLLMVPVDPMPARPSHPSCYEHGGLPNIEPDSESRRR